MDCSTAREKRDAARGRRDPATAWEMSNWMKAHGCPMDGLGRVRRRRRKGGLGCGCGMGSAIRRKHSGRRKKGSAKRRKRSR